MNIRTNILLRVYAAFGLIILFAVAVLVKMANVQLVQGDKYRAMADSLSTKYAEVEAARGNIYSIDGSLLATSVPEYDIRMDLKAGAIADNQVFYAKVDSLAGSLSDYFKDKSEREYSRALRNARKEGDRYFLIKRNISYQDLKAVKTFPIFNLGRYKGGMIAVQENKRILPFRDLASRTIGYYNANSKAAVGLEGAYGDYINGETGKRLVQRIAGGVWMPVNDDDEIAPKEGADIISTIDVNMQDLAQNALKKQLIKSAADFGCVIVMEVKTGEIKAISNFNKVADGEYKETFNYAIAQSAEPGSTFKLATYLVAIEDGKFGLNDIVNTDGGNYKIYNHTIRDHENEGIIPMKVAFEKSSNVAIVKQIYKNYKDDPSAFTSKLRALHLGDKLGLQIPGEGTPLIKTPQSKSWSGLTLPQMAYGYELKITPIQLLTLYNAVANNGKMIAPLFVHEIRRLGNTVELFKARVIKDKICSDRTLGLLKEMLEGVVTEGTAKEINNPLYQIAGKTGTAQVADGANGYKGKRKYQASFCGYFPANNPKYSMIVVVNNPTKGSYYASSVAGPVFREVADVVIGSDLELDNNHKLPQLVGNTKLPSVKQGYKKSSQSVYKSLGIKALYASTNENEIGIDSSNGIAYQEIKMNKGLVPNVSGMGLEDALFVLGNSGLKPIVKGEGEVKSQSLAAGTPIYKGTRILIELQ
ncbi:transpeptidase family protein [Pedobacter sp. SD-b]|uniref:Transpeptidase family protein n=1 Tax=Pedobacter segetis TaxID=2793069 RepID=A0ABS1BKE8_9SPHI|nr:penicillin-binding protein [Pedobacter segetis]MBK0383368.1 transpeptidase family protein [Pedobacter segetis]